MKPKHNSQTCRSAMLDNNITTYTYKPPRPETPISPFFWFWMADARSLPLEACAARCQSLAEIFLWTDVCDKIACFRPLKMCFMLGFPAGDCPRVLKLGCPISVVARTGERPWNACRLSRCKYRCFLEPRKPKNTYLRCF